VDAGFSKGGDWGWSMASVEHQHVMGALGQSPQLGPGAEPLVEVRGEVPQS